MSGCREEPRKPGATSGRPLSSSASRGRGRGKRCSITSMNLQPASSESEPVVQENKATFPGNNSPPSSEHSTSSIHSTNDQYHSELQAPLKKDFCPPVKPFGSVMVTKRGRGRRSLTSDEIPLSTTSPGKKTAMTGESSEPKEAVILPEHHPRPQHDDQHHFNRTQSAHFNLQHGHGLTTDMPPNLTTAEASSTSQQFSDTSYSLSQESEGTFSSVSYSAEEPIAVVLQIADLPPGVSPDDVSVYFEGQGEEVDVISTDVFPDGSRASVKLVGLTAKELVLIQKKRHRIKRKNIQVTVSTKMGDSDELPHDMTASPPKDTIVVKNLPSFYDEEYVSLYFENPKRSNGCPDSVESCSIVTPGTAHVKFKSPEFAAKVMEKEKHTIKGQDLHLEFKMPHVPEEHKPMIELNKLLLCNLPKDVYSEYLTLFVSNRLGIDEDKISVHKNGDVAVVTFDVEHTCEELKGMIEKLRSKPLIKKTGVIVDAQLYKTSDSILVSNVTKHYNEEFMEEYFENRGGGAQVNMLGNGKAVVTFENPQVISRVLSQKHTKLGEQCTVREYNVFQSLAEAHVHMQANEHPITVFDTSESSDAPTNNDSKAQSSKSGQISDSIEVSVDPLVAKCLKNHPSVLKKDIQDLHISFEVLAQGSKIRLTSSNQTKAGWQEEATKRVEACLAAHFVAKRGMQVCEKGMQELLAYLSNVKSETMLEYEFSEYGKILNVAGAHSAVSAVDKKAQEIFNLYKQTTVNISLTPEQFVFFEKVKQQQVHRTYPGVSFKMNASSSELQLHGNINDTMLLKTQLPEFLMYEAVDVPLDSLVVSYFCTHHGFTKLNELVRYNPGCPVAPFIKTSEGGKLSLQLLCTSNDESAQVSSVLETICSLTDVKHLQLPKSYLSVQHLVSKEYNTLCANLQIESNNQILISNSETHISIAGIAESVRQYTPTLSQFIIEKSSTTSTIEIDKGEWRLLGTHMKDRLDIFLSKCVSAMVEFKQPTSMNEPSIVLKGDIIQVQRLEKEFSELCKSILKQPIPMQRPGTCNFLVSKSTRMAFDGLEAKNRVAIEVTEPIKAESQTVGSSKMELSPQCKRKCVATITTKQIVIYIGDITEFTRAEVIVNAANVDLKHIGGVAMAISNKGGPIIQQDSDQYVRRKGKLSVGEAYLTKEVGNLPCKALVHAVGPVWSGGWSKEEALLGKACRDSLHRAKRYSSIVFPAISSGIYGFPIHKCAETMISSMIDFCNKNAMSELREIGIILPPSKSKDATHFVKALRKNLSADSVHADADMEETRGTFYGGLNEASAAAMSKGTKARKVPAVSTSVLNKIKLRKGSLLDVKVDVFVNTTNHNLDLSQGAVSKTLLRVGGQSLQSECNKQSPVSTGDIAVTGPGNLPCNYVIHTVISSYNGGQGEKVLKNSVQKCLKKCSSLGMSSIAFPAIGTGNLGYPNDAVARTMLHAITDYMSSHNKSSPITEVHLVIFMDTTYQAFQQELQAYRSGTTPGVGASIETGPAMPKLKSHRQYRSAPLRDDNPEVGTATQKEPTFTISNLQVQVLNGDITEERTDVIVNPTNSMLKLEGQGVAGALLHKGGPELQTLCDTVMANGKPLEGERVAVTKSTGQLKCKFLFHINFEGNDIKSFVKVITNCLKKAEDNKHTSISFPAIGTGTQGYPPQEAAAGMMKAIEQFSALNPHYVKCIRLVLFHRSAYQDFLARFRNPVQPGVWRKMWSYATTAKSTPMWKTDETVSKECYSFDNEFDEEHEVKELTIMVYGDDQKNIQNVEQEIYSLIDANFTATTVDDPYVDLLSPSQVQSLKKKGKELQVDIKIDPAPLNQITLKGDKADVHQMKSFVIESFAKFERSASRKREAEQLHRVIKWKRMDSQNSEYFNPETNFEIEAAYQKGDATYTHKDETQHFTINFSKGQVTDHCGGFAVQSVERFDVVKLLQQGERPKTWERMPTDPNTNVEVLVHDVDLKPTDEEYLKVKKQFDQTMTQVATNSRANQPTFHSRSRVVQQHMGMRVLATGYGSSDDYSSIVKIQRIQNPLLYAQYIARKKEVDKRNPSGSQTSERRLFHGTAGATCKVINQHGFNRSYSGKNATVYGSGVYFARDASYSARDTYSPRDINGQKYIYVARVITGEFTNGNSSLIDTPTKPDGTKYDSVVDNVQNPQIFVVFQDAVVYPEYLIVFT